MIKEDLIAERIAIDSSLRRVPEGAARDLRSEPPSGRLQEGASR
jgi:hypothetical protein